jgi:CubicO group peptidase (beta-lactamase class C family)
MQEQVFKPLNIKNISMFPSADMKSRLVYTHSRHPETGKISVREHINHRALIVEPGSVDEKVTLNSAGAGCFAQPSEYTKIIATLLNNGTDPVTKNQILKPETVNEMFKNQIEHFPNFGRAGIPAAKPEYTNALPDLYPQGDDTPQGWGLTFMLTMKEGQTGRGRNTGHWAGLPNLFWWADREKGVGGIVASQIVPFGGKSSALQTTISFIHSLDTLLIMLD